MVRSRRSSVRPDQPTRPFSRRPVTVTKPRIALTMVCGEPAWPRALDAEGLTVVGRSASVTSAGEQSSARGSA